MEVSSKVSHWRDYCDERRQKNDQSVASFDTKNRIDSLAHTNEQLSSTFRNFSKLTEPRSSHNDFGNRRVTLPRRISRFYECDENRAKS